MAVGESSSKIICDIKKKNGKQPENKILTLWPVYLTVTMKEPQPRVSTWLQSHKTEWKKQAMQGTAGMMPRGPSLRTYRSALQNARGYVSVHWNYANVHADGEPCMIAASSGRRRMAE